MFMMHLLFIAFRETKFEIPSWNKNIPERAERILIQGL